jgi:uncharacterized protein
MFWQQPIDCHAHICPDQVAVRNKKLIEKASGITPAYDGSLQQLRTMMKKAEIGRTLVNNVVLKTELIRKANDFTAKVVSNSEGTLAGMGCIAPGEADSVDEVERCEVELGFSALKMHHSHFRILPSDPRNDRIYERIVELRMGVLFHCGKNPYAGADAIQYSMPNNFLPVLKSYPEMKAILGHLGGYQDYPEEALELLSESKNTVADTALDLQRKDVDFQDLLESIGVTRVVFGSDYPIHDAAPILARLRASLPSEEFDLIASKNLRNFLPL